MREIRKEIGSKQELTDKAVIKTVGLNTVMTTFKKKVESTVQLFQPTAVSNVLHLLTCTHTLRNNPLMSFIHFQVS